MKWTEKELVKLKKDHEEMIETVLSEEEDMLATHKKYIDTKVELVKKYIGLLNDNERPESNV